MSFRAPRVSKFKHVFGNPYKKDRCYEAVKITRNAWDGNYCAVNPKFLAVVVESSGGGPFLVLPLDKVGRVPVNAPKVAGHRGAVLDLEWNPFEDNIIASSSEDCTIKIWYIPDGGISEDLVDYVGDLRGHERKVGIIRWHPCASGILASAGFDHVIIVWDVEREAAVTILKGHSDVIHSMSFNYNGSLIATTCKDKKIRVIDPREGKLVAHGMGHQGPKTSNVLFMGESNLLFTTGFSRINERQIAVWNIGNLKKALSIEGMDSSSGSIIPYYDNDTKVVFLAGKGDGNIRFYELSSEEPYMTFLNEYRSSSPQRGFGVMPKRGLDVMKCEIYRFYKLHNNGVIEPIPMVVPRRQVDVVQSDLYPKTPSMFPALSAGEWLEGKNANPILQDLLEGVSTGDLMSEMPLARKPVEISTRSIGRTQVSSPPDRGERSTSGGAPVRIESRVVSAPAPPRRNESSMMYSEKNRHGVNRDGEVQVVRATEVSRAPEGQRRDVIQATARKVPNEMSGRSPGQNNVAGTQHSGDIRTWDIERLRLAYQDQREEINFLKTQLKAKEARIWQLEQDNQRYRDRPRV